MFAGNVFTLAEWREKEEEEEMKREREREVAGIFFFFSLFLLMGGKEKLRTGIHLFSSGGAKGHQARDRSHLGAIMLPNQ